MSKYRRKKVLFICIGNACRSPMAEAIARLYASDVIDAFSAGLAPTGFVPELTKLTLMTNGCWVEGLESKDISPKVWEQVDIVINMSGRPRELTFYEYSKVEDWKIEDPYGQDPDTHQRVFEKIRRRVAKFAQECREEHAAVRFTERRARGRWYPTPPILINLNGGNDASVVNISEDGLALSAPIILSDVPLQDMHVQFLESPRPFEACCQIAWKSESQKEVGIQFVDLTEEARQHIRNWISAQAPRNYLPGQADELYEKQNPSLEVPNPPQWENVIPEASTSGEVINGEASLFSPVAVPTLKSANPPLTAPRTHARTGIRPNKRALPPRRTLARAQGSAGVPRRRSATFLILGFLFAFISLTVVWMTIQRNGRNEMITAVAQKPAVLSEAVKPVAPPPVITTPSVHNPQANKTQAQTSLVQSMAAERVDSIQDISPKHSPRPASPAKKPTPVFAVKPPSHRVETALMRGPSTNASSPVATNAIISPVEKTQQQAPSSLPPTPPQLETNIARLAVPAPLPSNDVRPPEPESKATSVTAAKQPATPANITGAVAVLADPYPSLRIPNGGSKKQRQGTSLQLGHLLSRVEPVYPEDAKQQGVQGTVKLHAVIDRHGSVENLQSVNGPPLLVAAAINAVRQWRFSETLLAGQTVETEEDIDVIFRLSDPGASRK